MLFIYNAGIKIYKDLIFLYSFFNKKAKLWIEGRHHQKAKISAFNTKRKCIWFHFASLGEFEQGRPVLEKLKDMYPDKSVVITFFSPSGYEIRKNYPLAELVLYLPIDTASNAKDFIDAINPAAAIFTKYEYWFHYFKELHHRNIPLVIISAIFRDSQPFFKWYGQLHRQMLSFVSHFFVQDEKSKKLLEKQGLKNVTVSGDTRFDRVSENSKHPKKLPLVEGFCRNSSVLICGSTWPDDEKLLAALAAVYSSWKFIIAPHEISSNKISSLESLFPGRCVTYSRLQAGGEQMNALKHNTQVLIIDNIGILSSLYQYGDAAYIGGGFGAGIHNTLEAAAFGLPVIFGPNYQKFREARDLINIGAGASVKNYSELEQRFSRLLDESYRKSAGELAHTYVDGATGASRIIIDYLKQVLK